jgi:SHS2 domain-containing protein
VLSPKERLEAAFDTAQEAFKNTSLRLADVEVAVKKVRKKAYAGQ